MTELAVKVSNAGRMRQSPVFQAAFGLVSGMASPATDERVLQSPPEVATYYMINPDGIGQVQEWRWDSTVNQFESSSTDMRTWLAELAMLDHTREWSTQELDRLADLTQALARVSLNG